MLLRLLALALGCSLMLATAPGRAEAPEGTSGLTLYTAQGIDTNLPDLPGRVVNDNLDFDDTHFAGASYTIGTRTPRLIDRAFRAVRVRGVTSGIDLIEVKHRGIQNHFESTVAYRLNSPYLRLGPLATRVGYSFGLSYAHGTPWYERTPDGERERLLTYMAYELELKLRPFERISLVTRVHHRSGAYGLFAPRGAGSNFLAVGLRTQW